MITDYMFEKIRSLQAQGKNVSQMARELKLDRKTVRKYLRSNSPPIYIPRKKRTREDHFLGFYERAKTLLKENEDWTAVDLFEVLVDEGFQGSERTVQRKIHFLRPPKEQERFFEQNYTPAEQSQFDFKEKVELPFFEGNKIIHLFFSTLPFSSHFFIKSFPFKNLECFQDGLHSFFDDIGGLTENIRFDNLTPCVKKVLKGNKRIYTEDFLKTTKYYNVGLLSCSPGKGSDKGDVERDIRTHARRIKKLVKFKKVVFRDFDHLNCWLKEYAEKKLRKGNREKFEEEKKKLRPLPLRKEEILCKIETFKGAPYGVVKLKDALYSIPDTFIDKQCQSVIGAYEVKITSNSVPNIIVTHPRKSEGEKNILFEHVLRSLLRKPAAMVRWAHREILFPSPTFKKYYGYLKEKDPLLAEKEFLKSVNLIQHTSWMDLEVGLSIILENKSLQPFEDLKELLLDEKRPPSTQWVDQPKILPNLNSYDYFINKGEQNKEKLNETG